jgi:hypothetical protein
VASERRVLLLKRRVPYLLKDIPDFERKSLSWEASGRNISVADVVRAILCQKYRLRCPQLSTHYNAERDTGSTTLLLRLHPNLDAKLKRERARTGRSQRRLIIEAIQAHYKEGEPS